MTCEYSECAEAVRAEREAAPVSAARRAALDCDRERERMFRLANDCADLAVKLLALARGGASP